MITTENLMKVYTTEEIETTALNNINMEVREGEYLATSTVRCGKTTLLNISV
jgi:putative ABC transport system ATP-binding protein